LIFFGEVEKEGCSFKDLLAKSHHANFAFITVRVIDAIAKGIFTNGGILGQGNIVAVHEALVAIQLSVFTTEPILGSRTADRAGIETINRIGLNPADLRIFGRDNIVASHVAFIAIQLAVVTTQPILGCRTTFSAGLYTIQRIGLGFANCRILGLDNIEAAHVTFVAVQLTIIAAEPIFGRGTAFSAGFNTI
jgi:hypothetical protein